MPKNGQKPPNLDVKRQQLRNLLNPPHPDPLKPRRKAQRVLHQLRVRRKHKPMPVEMRLKDRLRPARLHKLQLEVVPGPYRNKLVLPHQHRLKQFLPRRPLKLHKLYHRHGLLDVVQMQLFSLKLKPHHRRHLHKSVHPTMRSSASSTW